MSMTCKVQVNKYNCIIYQIFFEGRNVNQYHIDINYILQEKKSIVKIITVVIKKKIYGKKLYFITIVTIYRCFIINNFFVVRLH